MCALWTPVRDRPKSHYFLSSKRKVSKGGGGGGGDFPLLASLFPRQLLSEWEGHTRESKNVC